jgi:hypothetical protein
MTYASTQPGSIPAWPVDRWEHLSKSSVRAVRPCAAYDESQGQRRGNRLRTGRCCHVIGIDVAN